MKASATTIQALIERGLALQNQGDLSGAQVAYEAALRRDPEHPAALQLLGMLSRNRGEPALAQTLMRRSLRNKPDQPHVWNNLGNLLLAQGQAAEGLACFDQALKQQEAYADAHYNRARALHALAQLPQALLAVERAQQCGLTQRGQAHANALQLKGQIQSELGDLGAALQTVDAALAAAPNKPALLHNRGTLLQRLNRHQEALDMHQQAQALGLDVADAHYNLGNSLQSLGRQEEAVAAYRRALLRQANHPLALLDLARLRWRMGHPDFDSELRRASDAQPASAQAAAVRAHLLWRAERYRDAHVAYSEAVEREPQVARFHDGQGRCLVRMGDVEAGLAVQERAISMAPGDAELHLNMATSLLIARRPELAALAVQNALSLQPADIQAWAVCGLCWRLLGDERAAWLNDYGRLVSVVDLSPPPGFDSMPDFNLALTQELLPLHGDRQAPVDQTLRRGTQTFGDLFEQRHPLVDVLKQQIAVAIEHHVSALPHDPAHPFLARRAQSWRFGGSWSSRLASGGYHTHHVHPHGWLSSAYYVAVPEGLGRDGSYAGWLEFGQPDFDAGLVDPAPFRVEPRPGRLVLFPSLFWHGTAPFTDTEHRLSVAFDVVPQ